MTRACKWADHQLKSRRENQPLIGENPYAEMEERIIRYLQKKGAAMRSLTYKKVHGARFGLKTFSHAIKSLVDSGVIREEERTTKGPKANWLVLVPEEER
jgi:hypothetical protein